MRRVFVEAVEFSHQIFYPTEWFNVLQPWVKVCSTSHDLPSCKRWCLVHVASSRNDGRLRWQRGRYKSVYLKRKIEKSARCACPPSCVFNCDTFLCRPLLNSRELKQPRRRGQQERHKFAFLTMQKFFCMPWTCIFHFCTFADVLVQSTTCFEIVWMTWALGDKCSIFSSNLQI